MPITHALHRGRLVWLPTTRGRSRKKVEAMVKEAQAQLDRLAGQAKIEAPHFVDEGEWRVYLSVSARLERGRECGHCLGAATGGYGMPYIAVGKGETTYGFYLGPLQPDQVQGYANNYATECDWDTARALAEKYAHLASWHPTEGSESGARLFTEARDRLNYARDLELSLAVESGRLDPAVSLDMAHELDRAWTYWAPDPEDTERLREWIIAARERGLKIEYGPYMELRPCPYRIGGYREIKKIAPKTAQLDHYDPEFSRMSACAHSSWDESGWDYEEATPDLTL